MQSNYKIIFIIMMIESSFRFGESIFFKSIIFFIINLSRWYNLFRYIIIKENIDDDAK